MAPAITALADHARELSRATPHPVLGPPSLSVGRIEGGQSVNIVPDWCEIEVDRRVLPGERTDECLARVESFLRDRLGDLEGLEFLPPWGRMPPLTPLATGPSEEIAAVAHAVAAATGRTPQVTGVPYGTDAGPLSAAGLPCLVFGPGDIAQAHTKDEWVELDQVRTAVDAYYQIARALGRLDGPMP